MGLRSILLGEPDIPKTPTFGRYAEIPYDEMTPEQQEGYRFLVETWRARRAEQDLGA
jgi:hypothetical protein